MTNTLENSSILIRHPQAKIERFLQKGHNATIVNVTSKAEMPWRRFSPFFPHGDIPIPFWPERTAESVEGIWQGLKRFENENCVDVECFENKSLKGLKRTSRARGKFGLPRGRVLGHQFGNRESVLLNYIQARVFIYLPSYLWVLEKCLAEELAALRSFAVAGGLILVDYATNDELLRLDKPFSHAALIRAYLKDNWPKLDIELPEQEE